ncbi:MAG: CPBP family intramembrane metalloprotease [Muribaculaceae bacterium]|nr:CPBP family intramembrane metalloprotease [Muribaculaceae bacterium]
MKQISEPETGIKTNTVKLILTPGTRLCLFLCIALLMWVIVQVTNGFLLAHFGMENTRILRIAATLQSVFQFILPPVVTAVMITRLPARFLEIDRAPGFYTLMMSFFAIIAAIPALNLIIHLNNSVSFPEALSGLEHSLRAMETGAENTIAAMQGGSTVGDLIMNILIIGILAGVGEELFFRGGFQRLLATGCMGKHASVWTAAVVFSAMHLQFFGFIPRLLLGAYFGYLLLWTRSLWIPVLAHAFNNIVFVVNRWTLTHSGQPLSQDTGLPVQGTDWIIILFSVGLTAVCLYVIYNRGNIKQRSFLSNKG